MRRWLHGFAYGSVALLGGALFGAADPATAFSFAGPEVLKLDWGTRALNVSDVNEDGLNDLVVVNNDTAQIEVLYQLAEDATADNGKTRLNRNRWDPQLEDARFESEAITIGFPVFDLSVGDLNGDGRDDLAYTAREVPLTIRYQNEAGHWTDTHEFDNFEALGWTDTVQISDVDGDGQAELVVIAADALRVFRQDAHGHLGEAECYYLTGENPFNLLLEDVTGDGRKDILYITSNGDQSLALREQLDDGGFGPERRFVFERPVRSVRAMPRANDLPLSFCSVDSRSGGIEFFRLKKTEAVQEVRGFSAARPEIYPIFKKGRSAASYAFGDLNGDGQQDLLVANPAGAELVLFLKESEHFNSSQTFPSFSEISSMASGHFFKDDQDTVVIVSAGEKTMGVSQMDSSGRISFPRQLVISEGKPLVCEAVDLDEDGYDELALVSELKGKMALTLARPSNRKDADSEWVVLSCTELAGVKRKPSVIREVAIFEGNRRGLMIFVPREAPVLLFIDEEGGVEFEEVAHTSTIRESLLKDIQPAQVSVFDVDGDGANELVVGRSGYARALRVKDDTLEMVDQFNARRGDDVVSAVVPLYGGNTVQQLVFYVAAGGEFQLLERDEDGVFRYSKTVDVGKINLIEWHRLGGNRDTAEFIFAGEDRFWRLPVQADVWTRMVDESYETDLEDVHYSYVEGADFDADGRFDLIAVDGQNHVVEILVKESTNWESRMFWEVFEQNLHYQGRTGSSVEPREVVLADLTGDGKLDFAFLVHDRILFYPQE
jgi:hypothetical protein